MKRKVLARMVCRAWEQCIWPHYVAAEVNSEAALQALFCAYLLQELKARPEWRLFIEPRLTTTDGTRVVRPDVLVCNAHRVIGAIELKYVPRGAAKSKKDMDTLAEIADLAIAKEVLITNDRYKGPLLKKKAYSIADDALLVWAGVTARRRGLKRDHKAFAGGQMLVVHACTDSHGEPWLSAEPKVSGMWQTQPSARVNP